MLFLLGPCICRGLCHAVVRFFQVQLRSGCLEDSTIWSCWSCTHPKRKADTYIQNRFTERLCCKQKILKYLTLASSIPCFCKMGYPPVIKVEEPRGSMHNLYTQFLPASPSLKTICIIFMGWKLYMMHYHMSKGDNKHTPTYVSMYLHPRAPRLCTWTQIFNDIKVMNHFEKGVWRMGCFEIGSLLI